MADPYPVSSRKSGDSNGRPHLFSTRDPRGRLGAFVEQESPDRSVLELRLLVRHDRRGVRRSTCAVPSARGSILVSGYRGSGKTSLLIQSMLDAREILERTPGDNRTKLMVVPINISEISASLGQRTDDDRLRIDPIRLLAALLRELRNRMTTVSTPDGVIEQVSRALTKAVSTDWTEEQKFSDLESRSTETGTNWQVSSSNLLLTMVAVAAVISAGLGVRLIGGGGLEATLTSLAALMVVGFAGFRSTSRAHNSNQEVSLQVKQDGSLHQVESDVKSILKSLHDAGFRTVVVIEELDKMDDDGDDLERVIRYFKNLFTQAPALFFFVTDKAYFDAVASKIKSERSRGGYAIEHTFFTRRIYVSRPTAHECFDFIKSILVEKRDRLRID